MSTSPLVTAIYNRTINMVLKPFTSANNGKRVQADDNYPCQYIETIKRLIAGPNTNVNATITHHMIEFRTNNMGWPRTILCRQHAKHRSIAPRTVPIGAYVSAIGDWQVFEMLMGRDDFDTSYPTIVHDVAAGAPEYICELYILFKPFDANHLDELSDTTPLQDAIAECNLPAFRLLLRHKNLTINVRHDHGSAFHWVQQILHKMVDIERLNGVEQGTSYRANIRRIMMRTLASLPHVANDESICNLGPLKWPDEAHREVKILLRGCDSFDMHAVYFK